MVMGETINPKIGNLWMEDAFLSYHLKLTENFEN